MVKNIIDPFDMKKFMATL